MRSLALTAALWAAVWPAAAHEFLVYFRFGTADFHVYPEGRPDWPNLVIKDAACCAASPAATWVKVHAHADTAGPEDYNIELSRRRGERVADLLARAGVDRSKISVEAFGESRPAVATGDGVAEPLNRRATIDMGFTAGPSPRCDGPTLPKLPPR